MKYPNLASTMGAIVMLALLLTACGTAAPAIPTNIVSTIVATQPAVTESPVATESPAATASPATTQTTDTTATVGIPVTGNETTIKATVSEDYGPILADNDGRAVYLFLKDTQSGDNSACTDAECTAQWQPVPSGGAPVAGAGTIQNLLGTITREDGTLQVTYNGWPLYYFSGDTGAGSTNGQGTDNLWYLVSPSGKAIRK